MEPQMKPHMSSIVYALGRVIAIPLPLGRHVQGQRLLTLTFNDLGVRLAGERRYSEAVSWLERAIAADDTVGGASVRASAQARKRARRGPRVPPPCALRARPCTRTDAAGCARATRARTSSRVGARHAIVRVDAARGRLCVAFFLNRGDCQRALGRINEALTDFERAAELLTGDTKALWGIQSRIALIHNERGTQLFNHAAARHAAVEFSRAIECNPRVPHFYTNRAQVS